MSNCNDYVQTNNQFIKKVILFNLFIKIGWKQDLYIIKIQFKDSLLLKDINYKIRIFYELEGLEDKKVFIN